MGLVCDKENDRNKNWEIQKESFSEGEVESKKEKRKRKLMK